MRVHTLIIFFIDTSSRGAFDGSQSRFVWQVFIEYVLGVLGGVFPLKLTIHQIKQTLICKSAHMLLKLQYTMLRNLKLDLSRHRSKNNIIILTSMYLLFGKKNNHEFNLSLTFMTIEFLTEQQKIKKDKALKQLEVEYQDQLEVMPTYTDLFRCSYRHTLRTGNIAGKILLCQVMSLIEATSDQALKQFYDNNVSKVKLQMKNDKCLELEDVLELYNERDIALYNPQDVLEIIYEPLTLMEKIKVRGKKFIKNIPSLMVSFFGKFLKYFMRFLGFGSVTSIATKIIPVKIVMSWALNFLMVFFPALAPLIGISKLII